MMLIECGIAVGVFPGLQDHQIVAGETGEVLGGPRGSCPTGEGGR